MKTKTLKIKKGTGSNVRYIETNVELFWSASQGRWVSCGSKVWDDDAIDGAMKMYERRVEELGKKLAIRCAVNTYRLNLEQLKTFGDLVGEKLY